MQQADTEEPEQYEYVIKPAAVETLVNLLVKDGIDLRASYYNAMNDYVIFTTNRLIDIKRLKVRGAIRSYTVSKILLNKEIIDRG